MTLTMTQNLWDPAKTVLREKFIAIQSHPKSIVIKTQPYKYLKVPAGKNTSTPTKTTPSKNFNIA